MNTATSDIDIERIVNPISPAPAIAAAIGVLPPSMCRTMFSIITTASSTTKPTAMVSAINERLSRLKPSDIHHREGADQRERHRDRGDDRGPELSQEEKDDGDDEAQS